MLARGESRQVGADPDQDGARAVCAAEQSRGTSILCFSWKVRDGSKTRARRLAAERCRMYARKFISRLQDGPETEVCPSWVAYSVGEMIGRSP